MNVKILIHAGGILTEVIFWLVLYYKTLVYTNCKWLLLYLNYLHVHKKLKYDILSIITSLKVEKNIRINIIADSQKLSIQIEKLLGFVTIRLKVVI